MTLNKTPLLILFTSLFTCALQSESARVHKIYVKDDDVTVVKTEMLPIVNTPIQFMTLQLGARSPKRQQPVEAPEKIIISLCSHSAEQLYQKDRDRTLVAFADRQVVDLGLPSYAKFEGTPAGVKGIYMLNQRRGFVIRYPIPEGAHLWLTNAGKVFLAESMSTELQVDQITKMAAATRLELRLGDNIIPLTDEHLKTLREFAKGLMSAGGSVEDDKKIEEEHPIPDVDSNAPTDANNAPLDLTLQWLENELKLRGREPREGKTIAKFEAEVGNCTITYRLSGIDKSTSYESYIAAPYLEVVIPLAFINPKAIRLNDLSSDRTSFFLSTLDNEERVKTLVREMWTERVLSTERGNGALIELRKTKSASRIRDAIAHAAKLCQGTSQQQERITKDYTSLRRADFP